ncbi:SAM-dependent chlorinase/fluorinase [bacterium]|nr:SAM-dependent chlorinase/fluorinase [bacterium]MBU1073944.1 SAM-dependent chlorinase/fluorinase [bacterium]MBU1675809.1 SAM-dependent chlorinase/fluorinase [bacterium]
MSGTVITLTSDFGLADPYVAEMKAVVLSECARYPHDRERPTLIDVSHEVPAHDIAAAGWLLARISARFPAGTVHLVVVDPGVGTARPAVAAGARGSYHVGPGNGLFSCLAEARDLAVVLLDRPEYTCGRREPAPTFHGRDLFTVVAAHLAMGAPLHQVGSPGGATDLGVLPEEDHADDGALGRVIWIDRFGNAITDIKRDSMQGRRLAAGAVLRLGEGVATGPVTTYGAAARGELIWYWGSGGDLELAVRGESAAAVWNWLPGLALHEVLP